MNGVINMRLKITMITDQEQAISINYQHYLTAATYNLLSEGDTDYASFLHNEGYALEGSSKTFKLFCFSGLRAKARRNVGSTLYMGPGTIEWYVGSPVELFLRNFATGLLAQGHLNLGGQLLAIRDVQSLPSPRFDTGELHFTCFSPIVVGQNQAQGHVQYVRPGDGEVFSEAVRKNLLNKHRILYGSEPENTDFQLTFDAAYLADPRHRGGTKLVRYKDIEVVGAQAPFVVTGSPELIQVMYDCGAGEKNAGGFGMVEIVNRYR